MSANDDVLFDAAYGPHYRKGDRVVVTTIWGEEGGTVTKGSQATGRFPGEYPMVEINLDRGDTITINVARVRPEE